MVSRRPDQTRTATSVTWQGIHCVYRVPNRFRRSEPFHEDVSPCHGRNTQGLAAKSQTLTSLPDSKIRIFQVPRPRRIATAIMMMVQGTERARVTAISTSVLDCFLEARIVSNARQVMASILKSSEPY